jgi:hypothetical protein
MLLDGSFAFMDAGLAVLPSTSNYSLLDMNNFDNQSGFLIAYLSFEGTTTDRVYFDNFKATHALPPILQVDDYYPFGMTFNPFASGTENNYLYEGKEEQEELDSYNFHARMYEQ